MPKYRYAGESPVTVPDLGRHADNPVEPGEVVDSGDVVINNQFFDLVEDGSPAPAPEPEATTPESAPEPETPAQEA